MDEPMKKSGQWPNVAIEAGSDPAQAMREYGVKIVATLGSDREANLETYGKVPDQDECKKQQPMESGDTREQLEADVHSAIFQWGWDSEWSRNAQRIREFVVKSWLNRQVEITRREVLCQPDERDEQIAELTAEVEQLKRANRIQAESFRKLEQELKEAKAVNG